jgi:hypothetical protein
MPRSTSMEAVISLQHIFRVARAVNVDPSTGLEGAVAYIVDANDVEIIAKTWNKTFDKPPPLVAVVVDGLPRGARVEWHIIRCQKSSEDGKSSRFLMTFDESARTDILGEHGLCMIFGSQNWAHSIKSRNRDMALQTIPSKAVYRVSATGIDRHSSCTIIFSED